MPQSRHTKVGVLDDWISLASYLDGITITVSVLSLVALAVEPMPSACVWPDAYNSNYIKGIALRVKEMQYIHQEKSINIM